MSRFAIGVDLGGTNLRAAAVDSDGRILEKHVSPLRNCDGRDAVIDALCSAVKQLLSSQQTAGDCAGVGVGVPGIIYLETGLLRHSPNLPGWENFPVRDAIEQSLGIPVRLDNDANLAVLGEHWRGAGADVDSLCMITLGTGVGGGLIFNGTIWHGFLGMAGELGHIHVAENNVTCGCGSTGCLETEASATAIVRNVRRAIGQDSAVDSSSVAGHARATSLRDAIAGGESLSARLVHRHAAAGDPLSMEIFQSVGRYLGIAVAGLVNVLNLPLYVIAGGVSEAWDLFSPSLLEELERRSYIFAEGKTRVEKTRLDGAAGLLGAARLAFRH